MKRFRAATTRRLDAGQAALDLIQQIEKQGAGPVSIAGGLLLASAAAGDQGREVGRHLADRWPDAELLGSSFEGVLGEGQVWRDEPALGLFVWDEAEEAEESPIPFVFGADELEAARVAGELLDAAGRDTLGPWDLLLLFPDATGSPGLPAFLEELVDALGGPALAGAAASGLSGDPALGWSGDEVCPGALVGVLVLGDPDEPGAMGGKARVSTASATRAASPWLEITACRARWVDALEEEPPLVWVRRQLGLDEKVRLEPYLDRLLVRIRRRRAGGGEEGFDEQFLVGLDLRRGAISLPGEFERGDELAFALPDADLARGALRESIEALAPSPLILQFACRARDEQLHGDRDLESALVAHHAKGRATIGTLAPFQLGPGPAGKPRLLVFSTVLAALGEEE